jgi:hypothetical protein
MRFKSRGVLLALVAVFAMSAVTAAAASATTPEFKPVPTKHKFKGTSGVWQGSWGGLLYECKKGTVTGELTGARNLGSAVIAFTDCSDAGNGEVCPVNTVGAKSGEIVSKAVTGELGTIATKEAPSGVGVLLKPEVKTSWWTMVKNSCVNQESVWAGTLAAEVAVIGKKQTTNELVITPGSKKITLDSGVKETSELETYGQTAEWKNTFEVTFEEPVEVT